MDDDIYAFLDETIPDIDDGEAWDIYRRCSPADLHAFLKVLEEDLETADKELEKRGGSLEYLHKIKNEGPSTPEEEKAIPHLDRLIAEDEKEYRRLWLRWYDKSVRGTAMWNVIRHQADAPGEEVPTWNELPDRERETIQRDTKAAWRGMKYVKPTLKQAEVERRRAEINALIEQNPEYEDRVPEDVKAQLAEKYGLDGVKTIEADFAFLREIRRSPNT